MVQKPPPRGVCNGFADASSANSSAALSCCTHSPRAARSRSLGAKALLWRAVASAATAVKPPRSRCHCSPSGCRCRHCRCRSCRRGRRNHRRRPCSCRRCRRLRPQQLHHQKPSSVARETARQSSRSMRSGDIPSMLHKVERRSMDQKACAARCCMSRRSSATPRQQPRAAARGCPCSPKSTA